MNKGGETNRPTVDDGQRRDANEDLVIGRGGGGGRMPGDDWDLKTPEGMTPRTTKRIWG